MRTLNKSNLVNYCRHHVSICALKMVKFPTGMASELNGQHNYSESKC